MTNIDTADAIADHIVKQAFAFSPLHYSSLIADRVHALLMQTPTDVRRDVVDALFERRHRNPERFWSIAERLAHEDGDVTRVVDLTFQDWHGILTQPHLTWWPLHFVMHFASRSSSVQRGLLERFDEDLVRVRPDEQRAALADVRRKMEELVAIEHRPCPHEANAEEWAAYHFDRIVAYFETGARERVPFRLLPVVTDVPLEWRALLTRHLLDRVEDTREPPRPLIDLLSVLLEAGLPHEEQARLFGWMGRLPHTLGVASYGQNFQAVLSRAALVALEEGRLPDTTLATLRRTAIFTDHAYGERETFRRWLTPNLGLPLSSGEVWSDTALRDIVGMPADERDGWTHLLTFARTATGSKPSASWTQEGRVQLDRLGAARFTRSLSNWLPLVGKARPHVFAPCILLSSADPNLTFDEFNAGVLKGLLWLIPLAENTRLERTLGHVTETALRKVPGLGPRSPKIATAAVYALSRMDGEDALGQLTRLSTQVTFKTTLKEIQKALDTMAARLGVTRDDLAELGVPTYGLTDVGFRRETFGSSTVELRASDGDVRLVWYGETGKHLKSPPASVKRDFPEALAELKGVTKDIEKMLAAQRDRLDALMLTDRTWTFDAWRERYLDHPLVGVHARRLIWVMAGTPVLWNDNALRDVTSALVTGAGEVKLWHPLFASVNEVVAWRARLETLGVRQPFKQAHREVYLLTDAERTTRTYSNRFAAHVLRQHQFSALAALRGWDNKLRLMVDNDFPPPTRELPQYGLRAEFWVDGIGDDYGVDTNDSGTYLRLATDQVRFYRIDAPRNSAHASGGGYGPSGPVLEPAQPVPLEDVPPLVLSEVLRDVDLFVGVASVGNDPTWQDGGPDGRFQEYWQAYSFGDLSATAKTRREVLARLLPRLKIAARCHLTEKFLVVRGDLRTYKIHLGSGNILMEPNDQYLCIVPARGAASDSGGFTLPFEGDATFSVILSKAFLLANDTTITDPTITRQIKLH